MAEVEGLLFYNQGIPDQIFLLMPFLHNGFLLITKEYKVTD